MGKRRFIAPSWSLYSWSELKSISSTRLEKQKKELYDLFEAFDYMVLKSSKLASIYPTRWDGVERVDFLTKTEVEDIIEYGKMQKKIKKKKHQTESEDLIV